MCPLRGIKCPHLILGVLLLLKMQNLKKKFKKTKSSLRKNMCACVANGVVTCKQQCRPTFTSWTCVGQLRSTNKDCVPTAAVYRQTIDDNVLWTVITRMSCVGSNPLSRLRYRLAYMRLANCETLLIPIVAYNCPGLLKLQSLSLHIVYLWGSDYTTWLLLSVCIEYYITGDGSTLIIICRRSHWPWPD